MQAAITLATETAEKSALNSDSFCVLRIDVGLDTNAIREAITKVLEKQKVVFHAV